MLFIFLLKLIMWWKKWIQILYMYSDVSHNSLKNNDVWRKTFLGRGCTLYIGVYFFWNYQP